MNGNANQRTSVSLLLSSDISACLKQDISSYTVQNIFRVLEIPHPSILIFEVRIIRCQTHSIGIGIGSGNWSGWYYCHSSLLVPSPPLPLESTVLFTLLSCKYFCTFCFTADDFGKKVITWDMEMSINNYSSPQWIPKVHWGRVSTYINSWSTNVQSSPQGNSYKFGSGKAGDIPFRAT